MWIRRYFWNKTDFFGYVCAQEWYGWVMVTLFLVFLRTFQAVFLSDYTILNYCQRVKGYLTLCYISICCHYSWWWLFLLGWNGIFSSCNLHFLHCLGYWKNYEVLRKSYVFLLLRTLCSVLYPILDRLVFLKISFLNFFYIHSSY